jgi:hypothetical protein
MFRRAFQAFLPDQRNKRLFPGLVFFFIAIIGATIAFATVDSPLQWLRTVAFSITAFGVIGGAGYVFYGMLQVFLGRWD